MYVIARKLELLEDLGMRDTGLTRKRRWGLYRCACGKEFEKPVHDVKSGNTKSCGCLRTQPIAERLAAHSVKVGDCLVWTGHVNNAGYGQTSINHRPVLAHRAAYTTAHGEIPDGIYVLHTCDVRTCINPTHLFLGTHADNMQDMVKKGRSVKGERVATSKLNDSEVFLIFDSDMPVKELAKVFNVSLTAVYRIKNSATWQHLTGAA